MNFSLLVVPRKSILRIPCLFAIYLLSAWTLHVFVLNPILTSYLVPGHPVLLSMIRLGLKALIWCAPLPWIIRYFTQADPLYYLKLNTRIGRGVLWGLVAGLLYLLLFLSIDAIWGDGRIELHQSLEIWMSGILWVGLIEELPFRGFILPKLNEGLPFVWANIVTGLLFLLAHFPGWIAHLHPLNYFLFNGVSVLIRGLFFGWLVKRTGSIWSAVLFHSINNLVHFTIFG